MGQQLSHITEHEIEFNSSLYTFFKDLPHESIITLARELQKTQNVLLSCTTASVDEEGDLEALRSRSDHIQWKIYFQLFSDMKTKMRSRKEEEGRVSWHPATTGYAMEVVEHESTAYRKKSRSSATQEVMSEDIPDDYTDDGAGDEEEEEVSEESGSKSHNESGTSRQAQTKAVFRRPVDSSGRSDSNLAPSIEEEEDGEEEEDEEEELYRPAWNPSLVSPIFFGYSSKSLAEQISKKGSVEGDQLQAETRALERAREAKVQAKADMEKQSSQLTAQREKELETLKKKYVVSTEKREQEYVRNQEQLGALQFKFFAVEWNKEKSEADASYELEVGRLERTLRLQASTDRAALTRLTADLEQFDASVDFDRPTAVLVEKVARDEIARWTEVVHKRCGALEVVKEEYANLKNSLFGRRGASKAAVANLDDRSMAVVSLTRLKEAQKQLEEAVMCLDDAEMLLQRAVRTREQEVGLLPLFQCLGVASEEYPSSCPLNMLFAALCTVIGGAFDQKVSLFLNLFMSTNSCGVVKRKFLVDALHLLSSAARRLGLLPFRLTRDEIESLVGSALIDMRSKEEITLYQTKNVFRSLLCHNKCYSSLFGFRDEKGFSSYQRTAMHPIALYSNGILDMPSCKQSLHRQLIRFKPQLHSQNKVKIHDLAMSQGQNDPLKVDYRAMINKGARKSSGYIQVEALDHGHLLNLRFVEGVDKCEAALRIQNLYRSFRERRYAEYRARQQAFVEAKTIAVKGMKDNLVAEFRLRESSSGMGRMKWDAQVRLKQGKLRSAGQAVTRSETVMIMMEEALQRATVDVEAKFKELQARENVAASFLSSEGQELVVDDPSRERDIAELFGISHWTAPVDLGNDEGSITDEAAIAEPSKVLLSPECVARSLEGRLAYDNGSKGEDILGRSLRFAMSFPAPEVEHFIARLRAIDSVFTVFKVTKFVSELPSKRLLLKMVNHLTAEQIASELQNHFKLARNHLHLADTFKRILASDLEMGLYPNEVFLVQQSCEVALQMFIYNLIRRRVVEASSRIDSRLQSTEGMEEDFAIQDEIRNNDLLLAKFNREAENIASEMDRLRRNFQVVLLSLKELRLRESCWHNVGKYRRGDDFFVEANDDDRKDWMKRMRNALLVSEDSDHESRIKFAEISAVCKEFLEMATSDSMIIVQEYYLPNSRKTIPIADTQDVDGRSTVSGRGLRGKKLLFEAHNIQYRVCFDDDGIFNGSDECAAKAAGNDRLFSLQYAQCHTPSLNIPLIAVVDYYGFRVVATSIMPTTSVMFSERGEVRRTTEELVVGIVGKGDLFVNKNRKLQSLLESTARKLKLAEHSCRGRKDISGSATFCSADIKIFKGPDGEFYLRDFSNAFPPELPEATPHLFRSPRDQSIFWRRLRPEFLLTLSTPLSPDGGCRITYHTLDQELQYEQLLLASTQLINTSVPDFVEYLVSRTYSLPMAEGLGIDISHELHVRGINVRHLGLVRSMLWRDLPGECSLFDNETFLRASRDLREEVQDHDRLKIDGVIYSIHETVKQKITYDRIPLNKRYSGRPLKFLKVRSGAASKDSNCESLRSVLLAEMTCRAIKNILRAYLRAYALKTRGISSNFIVHSLCEFLNVVTGASEQSDRVYQDIVFPAIQERFGSRAVFKSERENLQSMLIPCIPYSVRRLVMMFNVQLTLLSLSEFHKRPRGFGFGPSDINSIQPNVRHNVSILPFAEATLATLQARQAEMNTYQHQVLEDNPEAFFLLGERKGSRTAVNLGVLGPTAQGIYSKACELYVAGSVTGDSFSKALSISPEARGYVEISFVERLVPHHPEKHFSFEVYAKCLPSKEVKRVVLMTSRYALFVSRENIWTFIYILGAHEVAIRFAAIQVNEWEHIVCTFDGTTARCYVNSTLCSEMEVEYAIHRLGVLAKQKLMDQYVSIEQSEKEEREAEIQVARNESEEFFLTKEGVGYLSTTASSIMETKEFIQDHLDDRTGEKNETPAQLRGAALKLAKKKYFNELYVRKIQAITDKYLRYREELQQRLKADEENEGHRLRKPLLLGCDGDPKSNMGIGNNHFIGHLCNFAIYSKCLSSDRIRSHYLASSYDKSVDACRMYSIASTKYEEALKYLSDTQTLEGYARALCGYLKMEGTSHSQGKDKVLHVIRSFAQQHNAEAIAEILRFIPRKGFYSDVLCAAYNAITDFDPLFFSKNKNLSRKDLIFLPKIFFLDDANNPSNYLVTAAKIYKEVMLDQSLAYSYGEVDLSWISKLESAELVIAIVQHAIEDFSLDHIIVGKLFKQNLKDEINIIDADIKVLAHHLPLTSSYDLTSCIHISSKSLQQIVKNKCVVALTLDNISSLTDDDILILVALAERLQVLSLANLRNITDKGLLPIISAASHLRLLNVNLCVNLSQNSTILAAECNPRLETLSASTVYFTNEGFLLLCKALSPEYFTSIDISYCREITDSGVMALAQRCPKIVYVNLAGLSRVTGAGIRNLCEKCWCLKELHLRDLFLLNDSSFRFNHFDDNRQELKMLKALQTIDLSDCANLTDNGISEIIERATSATSLCIRGCDKLTNRSLLVMTKGLKPSSLECMSSSLLTLDVSFCRNITADGILNVAMKCSALEDLNISGIHTVDDAFIIQLCSVCPTLISLSAQRCMLISDGALCAIAKYLWMNALDVSFCSKVTDEGIEVLTLACAGLLHLKLRKLTRITDKSLKAIYTNTMLLKSLDVKECCALTAGQRESLSRRGVKVLC